MLLTLEMTFAQPPVQTLAKQENAATQSVCR